MAATLTLPTGTAIDSTSASGTVDTDTNGGVVYTAVTQSATSPSAAQVKLGQDHLGNAADFSSNATQDAFPPVTLTVIASGLSAATTYAFHFMHETSGSVQSNVASSSSFVTLAPAPDPQVVSLTTRANRTFSADSFADRTASHDVEASRSVSADLTVSRTVSGDTSTSRTISGDVVR